MHNQARVLQYIPVMQGRTRCTNTLPTPSIWQRARAAVSSAVAKVRVVVARVVAVVAKKATGARASIARVARAAVVGRPWIMTCAGAGHAASLVSSWCQDTWRRVVRPFMRVRVAVIGIGAVVVGLVAAPVATLVILAGCGAALVGLSRLIAALDASDRAAARVVLMVIEYAARAGRVVAYVAATAVVVALCLVSAAFAATEVLELVLRYRGVANATSLAALAFFVLTANWGLVVVETAWLALAHSDKLRARTQSQERQEIPLIRIDAERAWNGDAGSARDPEVLDVPAVFASPEDACRFGASARSESILEVFSSVDNAKPSARTGKCEGCDLDDGSPRFGIGRLSSLCGECFSFLVEDELVCAAEDGQVSADDVTCAIGAGIRVPAVVIIASGARLRRTRVELDVEDITVRTSARALSELDASKVHWAETAWWFDARGNRRPRQWHGFVSGRVAAKVDYEHDRSARGFYVSMPTREDSPRARGMGPYRSLSYAQEIAADEVSDLAALAGRASSSGGARGVTRSAS
jgi:hypothetical protein